MTEYELIDYIKELIGSNNGNDLLNALKDEGIAIICNDKQTVQDAIDLITSIENLFN